MSIKEQLKKILPDSIINIWINSKKTFYVKWELLKYPFYLKRINRKKQCKEKITIVFYASMPEFWNSLKSVYKAASVNPKVNAYVFLLPMKSVRNGVTDWNYVSEKFYVNQNLSLYKSYDKENHTWLDLRELKPDYVFFEWPYNDRLPKHYRSSQVEKYAKVCYVPYGYILTDSQEVFKVVFNEYFFVSLYIFFASWKDVGIYCDKLFKRIGCKERKVIFSGYPRFDLMKKQSFRELNPPFHFMWIPRFQATYSEIDPTANTSFFNYKDKILERCREKDEEVWLIRPHPLAFQTYIEQGLMTCEEVENYKTDIEHLKNVSLDECKDYLVGFSKADILVADFSSVIIEYFVTGKPIIFCGNLKALPLKELRECVYPVENWKQLEDILERLKSGVDPLKERRIAASKGLRVCDSGMIGSKIVQYIIDDYENRR